MSQINTNAILDASGGTTATINGYTPTASNMGGKNRIINGDMRIDQRNAGAAVTVNSSNASAYVLDRWQARQEASSGAFSVQRTTTAPTGFTNSLLATVTTADTSLSSTEGYSIYQGIEGFNTADLMWGTANAQAITISFWVRASVTGSYSLQLINIGGVRNYGALYTVSSANTWEYKTIVIPGDTTGTWNTENDVGIFVGFGLGAGTDRTVAVGWSNASPQNRKAKVTGGVDWISTNGATFYITGVQLEEGSVATPFERRDYGRELELCQRYFWRTEIAGAGNAGGGGSVPRISISYPCTMRAAPTITWVSGGQFSDGVTFGNITGLSSTAPYTAYANMEFTSTLSGGANGRGAAVFNALITASSEL